MYDYVYDETTGGILLTIDESKIAKEPRPVYAAELDLLGFDKFWKYDKQNDAPYMWAEANVYVYRGKIVARLKGGNVFDKPEIVLALNEDGTPISPENDGGKLRVVNIEKMVKKNHEKIMILEQTTVKSIQASYNKFRGKIDSFHVAFSGGKDSIVLLELIKKSLPLKSYFVIFGDTGMEFPDTYETVAIVKEQCKKEGIDFYVSKSHMDVSDTWDIFAPPSRTLRWCCSVHKSTPQTLFLRHLTEKKDFIGLDYVGVRAYESERRKKYTVENYGKKQKGQYSHNSILHWSSAEVWLYIFTNNLVINNAYKKGNARAGCLFCPMSNGANNYIRRQCYTNEIDFFIDKVKERYACDKRKKSQIITYITNGGWNARKNGRDLTDNPNRYIEITNKNHLRRIEVVSPTSNWLEWIKTLGNVQAVDDVKYTLSYEDTLISFEVKDNDKGYTVSVCKDELKPSLSKLFKQVFRKASYCVGCRVCETNCKLGRLVFEDGNVKIDNCIHCHECHDVDSGCLAFHSLRYPQGGGDNMKKSLNAYADHAPKYEWFKSFFELKDGFFINNSLGPNQFDIFKRFLKEAGLREEMNFSQFAEMIEKMGWESPESLALMLVNLVAESLQFQWYVKNLEIGQSYTRAFVESQLNELGVKEKDSKSIVKAFKRIVDTPFGATLQFGNYYKESKTEYLCRTKCFVEDNRVILYSLYKFAEKCDDFKEFNLSALYDTEVEREGVSPALIFGIEREEFEQALKGLSAKYPEYIFASFTHNLERITLREDKTSVDVLSLFNN